ncbi:hypothetical protein CMV_014912 [Castanea mollissima]|uniref:Uncharacterized protein n=1 Tax=Castanea mollissima TaxID=60419 RepID=A0A8J4QX31_9ROSI|nr:hypothetical protein CMV_014912 [Castanea mollissima]
MGDRVEGRGVLLVAGAENPEEFFHDLIKVIEDHSYEVFKCNGVDGFLSQIKKNRIDIILTEGNLLDPMYVSQHLPQILRGMNLPVIMISSNDNNINSHYHWSVSHIVRPMLDLVGNFFYDRIFKSGEVKRLKEEIKQVEFPDEEKRLNEEVEHDELPDEEKLPEEKRLKEEVEHAELPDEENKKKLEREKAGEHHQRMVWTGDRERMFVKIVTELDKNGKATGKKVREFMQA